MLSLNGSLIILIEIFKIFVVDDHLEEEVLDFNLPKVGGERKGDKMVKHVDEEYKEFLVYSLIVVGV